MTVLFLLVGGCACAQTKPNFSGTWKLNVPESDYSDKRAAVPDSLVWKLEQRSDRLTLVVEAVRKGQKNGFTADIEIGGPPFESNEAGIIAARWKPPSLLVDTLYNPDNERRASMEEIWTLSDDGRKLIDAVVFHVPKNAANRADVVFRRVFDKQ